VRNVRRIGVSTGIAAILLALLASACGRDTPSASVVSGAAPSVQRFTVHGTVNPRVASSGGGVVVVGGASSVDELPTTDGLELSLEDGGRSDLPAIPGTANALSVTASSIGDRSVLAAVIRCADRSVGMATVASCSRLQLVTAMLDRGSTPWAAIPIRTPDDLAGSLANGGYLPTVSISSPDETGVHLIVQAPVARVSHMYGFDAADHMWQEQTAPPAGAQVCATGASVYAMSTEDTATEPAVIGTEPPGKLGFSRLAQDEWSAIPAVTSADYGGTPYLVCTAEAPYVVSSSSDRGVVRFENVIDATDRTEVRLEEPQPLSFVLGGADRLFAFTFKGETVGWSPGSDPTVRHDLDAAPTAATFSRSTGYLTVVAGAAGVADRTSSAESAELVALPY
jgi:hypothetical protein